MTSCEQYADAEIAERYVLGQMDEAEQAAFEEHFFGCDPCLAEVQALQQMQAVLLQTPLSSPGATPVGATGTADRADAEPAVRVDSSLSSGAGSSSVTSSAAGSAEAEARRFGQPSRSASASVSRPSSSAAPSRLMTGARWVGLALAASLLLGIVWWQRRAIVPEQGPTLARETQPSSGPPSPGPSVTPAPGSASETTTPGSVAPGSAVPGPGVSGSAAPGSAVPGSAAPGSAAPAQPGAPRTSPSSPATEPARPPRDLGVLALIVPPPYLPLQTRGAAEQAAAFAAAMARYNAKDYQAAADQLRSVAQAQPDAAHVQFFRGIALLMINQPAEATEVFDHVVATGTMPFADEAHYYLAKAAIAQRDLPRAERELQLAIDKEAGPAGEAARLLRELRRIGE